MGVHNWFFIKKPDTAGDVFIAKLVKIKIVLLYDSCELTTLFKKQYQPTDFHEGLPVVRPPHKHPRVNFCSICLNMGAPVGD